jgi:hypothetical protein
MNSMRKPFEQNALAILLSMCFACSLAGCIKVSKEDLLSAESSGGGSTNSNGEALKEFRDGGTMSLTASSQPVSVTLDSALYLNADEGDFDVLEIGGEGTYITFKSPGEYSDDDPGGPYASMLFKSFHLDTRYAEDDLSISLPGLGEYEIHRGEFILTKFEEGMEGNDHWDGSITLEVNTSQGVLPVSGTVSMTVTPVW